MAPMPTVRMALLRRDPMPPGHLWPSVRKPMHFGQVAIGRGNGNTPRALERGRCGVEPEMRQPLSRRLHLEAGALRKIDRTREPVPLIPSGAREESGDGDA